MRIQLLERGEKIGWILTEDKANEENVISRTVMRHKEGGYREQRERVGVWLGDKFVLAEKLKKVREKRKSNAANLFLQYVLGQSGTLEQST